MLVLWEQVERMKTMLIDGITMEQALDRRKQGEDCPCCGEAVERYIVFNKVIAERCKLCKWEVEYG